MFLKKKLLFILAILEQECNKINVKKNNCKKRYMLRKKCSSLGSFSIGFEEVIKIRLLPKKPSKNKRNIKN